MSGLYLNVQGRESNGVVRPGAEADALKRELVVKLSGLRDEERGRGRQKVRPVGRGEDVYHVVARHAREEHEDVREGRRDRADVLHLLKQAQRPRQARVVRQEPDFDRRLGRESRHQPHGLARLPAVYVERRRDDEHAQTARTRVATTDSLLVAPRRGARVKAPLVLRWRAVGGARYYNVQVFRGRRLVRTAWPSRKSATNSVLWFTGEDIPFIPNKRFGGVCLGNSLVRVSFIGGSFFLDSLCRFEVTG